MIIIQATCYFLKDSALELSIRSRIQEEEEREAEVELGDIPVVNPERGGEEDERPPNVPAAQGD